MLRAQCNNVDLQAISIDPLQPRIGKGETTSLVVSMTNNGPCPIPKSEARFTVTLPDAYLEPAKQLKISDGCVPAKWTLFNQTHTDGFYTLTFSNAGGPLPAGGTPCAVSFNIKAIGQNESEPVTISLVSSLSALATTGDVNGINQSVLTKLHITSGSLPVKENVTDFSGKAKECDALLSWKAETDQVDKLEVEYGTSEAGLSVVGPGTTNFVTGEGTFTNYQGNGKGYYRLKITGKNGKISYSNVVMVETKCVVKKGFNP